MVVELQERPRTEGEPPAEQAEARPLRVLADQLNVPEGYRVEILGGSIVVSPRGSSVHGKTILRLARQLEDQLPEGLDCMVELDVESTDDTDNELIPDVLVVPQDVEEEDPPRIEADAVEMTVEVVSRGNWRTDYETKAELYARWNIPIYLIVDPRDGTLLLHHDPDPESGKYRATHQYGYGAQVQLPEPLPKVTIDTSDFRRYQQR